MVDNHWQLPYCRGQVQLFCPLHAIISSSNFKFQTLLHNLEMKQFFNCLLMLTIPQKLPAVSFRWLMNLYEQTGNQQSADYCRQTALWFKGIGQKYYQSRQTSLLFNRRANRFSICHPCAWSLINTNIWERYTWEWPWIWWSQHKTVLQTNTTHFIELTHLKMGDGFQSPTSPFAN